jgi:hypothetical protein
VFGSSLQLLVIPDVVVTAGAVLPSSLRVLTVKCFDPDALPAACSTLQGLTALQELKLAQVPRWKYTDGNLAGIMERTVRALLPYVQPLSRVTHLTVIEANCRGGQSCEDACTCATSNYVLTPDTLRAWFVLKEGLPAVDLRLNWLRHCAGHQQHCLHDSMGFEAGSHNSCGPLKEDPPLTVVQLARLHQIAAGVTFLSFNGRDVHN